MEGIFSVRRVCIATLVSALVAAVALPLLSVVPGWGRTWSSGGLSGLAFRPAASTGRSLTVRLISSVSSASARVGDRWIGVVVRPVAVGSRYVIQAGTLVRGVVTDVSDARSGASAKLELAIQDLVGGGMSRPFAAVTESFVAGTPRPLRMGGSTVEEVVLKPRTVMVFTLDERIAMR